MNIAVVGHLEWGDFVKIAEVPAPGEIVHATESWQEAAGGGAVAAMQIAALNGTCTFFTSVGDDENGRLALDQLRERDVEVFASIETSQPTRKTFVQIDDEGERTITVIGNLNPSGRDVSLPWGRLAEMDAVYFVSGDVEALRFARKAKVLVSTARIAPLIQQAQVAVDILVASANDRGEEYHSGDILPPPGLVITTNGSQGGLLSDGLSYQAEIVPDDQFVDSYGCGDSFAAGLTYGLGKGLELSETLKIAAKSGANAAKRRGTFSVGA